MALPAYFRRSAVAVAQILAGFDEEAIRKRLDDVVVGLAVSREVSTGPEGQALVDLTVRLLARIYPCLRLEGDADLDPVADLARAINPEIELTTEDAHMAVALGNTPPAIAPVQVFAGSSGWDAEISVDEPRPVGLGANPIGAGIAACIACANVFRLVFLDDGDERLDRNLTLSGLDLTRGPSRQQVALDGVELGESAVLVGAGAIGNSAVWALGRSPARGQLHIVDPQTIEHSNLQRYVLATENDVDRAKGALARDFLASELEPLIHDLRWQDFSASNGSRWERVLVALDSAGDRRAVQASLPRWIANAWTQAGDLGISVHPWDETGACLTCMYLPQGEIPSEDKLVAAALGMPRPEVEAIVRNLLWANAPPPRDLLEEAAQHLEVPLDVLLPYAERPLRDLYMEGICGGAALPLDRIGQPARDVHVPLAHQSALAGVLLASRLLAAAAGTSPDSTRVTRIDVQQPISEYLTQPAQKDPRGICICQDPVYREAYNLKYSEGV
jgi:Prokaryotic E2 family C/ThiF family